LDDASIVSMWVGIGLIVLGLAILYRKATSSQTSPPPFEDTRKVPKKTQKEIAKLVKIIEEPPPPPAPDWAKFTVALMSGVGKVWGELKLLIVGTFLFYLFIMPLSWDTLGVDYTAFQWIRFIALALGSFAVWRWIMNNARWEPKPLSGGRWIALVLVAVIVCSAVITVVAIMYMPQLIELIRFLRTTTGANGNFGQFS